MADWEDLANEELRAIGDLSVGKTIWQIADTQLRPDADDEIEGPLDGDIDSRFRRCIWVSELPEYLSFDLDGDDQRGPAARDYCLVYRALTLDEQIRHGLEPGFVKRRVVPNAEMRRLLMRNGLSR
ncbi:hypothetical protein CQ018_00200 [Arthrobacter sp. MYb227]|uniref:hypothetical protein n=1 Tax=Arthrobacter sp. MYb227 TaxID=1848601 RepID=UPI000CFD7086|nr:hypothetical protein [Arthrobacter sp. MYb227]PQZ95769.1 hypothetical protein CQ018_00200 [Arthrobacter sp. MYb227]